MVTSWPALPCNTSLPFLLGASCPVVQCPQYTEHKLFVSIIAMLHCRSAEVHKLAVVPQNVAILHETLPSPAGSPHDYSPRYSAMVHIQRCMLANRTQQIYRPALLRPTPGHVQQAIKFRVKAGAHCLLWV